eukprot:TRINITY_DN24172_c0_g2_i1.p1 TRINITY_DN24172_c0_g2~~TRINITY_DN24172_c0_g2_i1.p1  ORF type:complete len:395 (-),score=134.70 TRINITY_DN24172_c0_g2_i1:156-1340(-)
MEGSPEMASPEVAASSLSPMDVSSAFGQNRDQKGEKVDTVDQKHQQQQEQEQQSQQQQQQQDQQDQQKQQQQQQQQQQEEQDKEQHQQGSDPRQQLLQKKQQQQEQQQRLDDAHMPAFGAELALILAPGMVLAAALALGFFPEKSVEVHLQIHVDLRATALLGSMTMALVAFLAKWWSRVNAAEASTVAQEEEEEAAQEDAAPPGLDIAEQFRQLADLSKLLEEERSFLVAKKNAESQAEKERSEQQCIERIYSEMISTSPALVYRFSAQAIASDEGWSSPVFASHNRLWSLRTGPLTGSGARFFCLLPHGGHTDRLRSSFFFARSGTRGYKERKVHDWPAELKGHPWGPTMPADEIKGYLQADGSVLVMIHAVGLGDDSETVLQDALSGNDTT